MDQKTKNPLYAQLYRTTGLTLEFRFDAQPSKDLKLMMHNFQMKQKKKPILGNISK